jgi:hypothetical protein
MRVSYDLLFFSLGSSCDSWEAHDNDLSRRVSYIYIYINVQHSIAIDFFYVDFLFSVFIMKTKVNSTNTILAKLPGVLKCNGPKLVPFFKTVAIFFILFPKAKYRTADLFYLVFKCLPICSLILFILLHGINLRGFEYSYSRRILTGLAFSLLGDALLVYDHSFFIHGVLAFGISHVLYASAYGMRPLRVFMLPFMVLPVIVIWLMLSGVLIRPLSYVVSFTKKNMFSHWNRILFDCL